MELAIDAVGIAKTYDDEAGLRHLDLKIESGAVVGLIGPSGAGKTTAVRLITGLMPREAGELTVLGSDPNDFGPSVRSQIGYLPQDTRLYPKLSVRENLDFIAATYGLRGKSRRRARSAALEFVELDDVGGRRLEALSGGMRRRAGLAAALLHEPRLLVLDEPTAGQDPILRRTIWQHLRDRAQSDVTVFVTTQHVDEAGYCDAVALIADGRLVAMGAPDDLRRNAFGGELVDVDFDAPPSWAAVQAIGGAVNAVGVDTTGSRSVRYTVEDAGVAIPAILEAAESADVVVAGTDRHVPDFDETFVRLVDRVKTS